MKNEIFDNLLSGMVKDNSFTNEQIITYNT